MRLDEWEPTIQKIVDEYSHEPKASGKHRILKEWRAKLENEPPHLQPYQIDEIMPSSQTVTFWLFASFAY